MIKNLVITDIPYDKLEELLKHLGDYSWSAEGVDTWEASLIDFIYYDFKLKSYMYADKIPKNPSHVHKTFEQVMKI